MIDYGIWGRYTHYIVDTDYENYAVSYGCDNYFIFFYIQWATLMSKEQFLEYPFVRKAKDFLDTIDYPYDTFWVPNGESCGFEAAPTLD
jgi:hypothetical protein